MDIMIVETLSLIGKDPRYQEVWDRDTHTKVAAVTSLNSRSTVRCYCPDEKGTLVYEALVSAGDPQYHIRKMESAIEKYYLDRDQMIVEKVTESLKRSRCLEPFEPRDIIEQKDEEIARLKQEVEEYKKLYRDRTTEYGDLVEKFKAKSKESDDLFLKLHGVMWSVDKWLDGKELEQDEVNRAIAMREKTLQITEKQQAEIERLQSSIKEANEHLSEGDFAKGISIIIKLVKVLK